MITNSIQSCISAINQKRDAQKNKQSFEEYKKTLAALSVECQSLSFALDTADGIKKHKISTESMLSSETKSDLLDSIDQCGIGLEDGKLTEETVQSLRLQTKQLQNDLITSWKVISAHYAEGVTGYLGIVQGFSDSPADVEALRIRIQKLTTESPSAEAAKKLSIDVSQANTIIAQFSLKPEVEVFLRKVASREASAADLTPNVLEWLQEQKLLSKLRISF